MIDRVFAASFVVTSLLVASPARADFGEADFPAEVFQSGPRSYHDAWCRKIKNKCRVRFQGPAMWIEGQGGIQRDQLIGYRLDEDGDEFYNYVRYKSSSGIEREALFLFAHYEAQKDFLKAMSQWRKQQVQVIPNYRYPASQGPQDTQGRDKSYGVPMNPYERPPITDWKEKTTP
jgi:hypothetical protein